MKSLMERVTGLEPATVCLEGRNSSQLSYTRKIFVHITYKNFETNFKTFLDVGIAGLEPATKRL